MANVVRGEKREGEARLRSAGGIAVLEETYSFIVETETVDESRINVLLTPGIPQIGITQSAYGNTVCRSVSATRREDNPKIWDIVCEFSSEVDEKQNSQNTATDPTAWVPIRETKFERLQEVVTRDKDGTAVANSAGQPFENGLTISRFIPVWEFFQFESAALSDESLIDRNETVNSAVYKGKAAKTLLLTVMSSAVGFYYGQRRRLTQYSIKYNKKKWTNKRLDVGTVYLSGGVHLPYEDSAGNIILGGLNGSGAKVAIGSPPSIKEFDMFDELDFSSFLRI